MALSKIHILIVAFAILLAGSCNTTDKGKSSNAVETGTYALQAQRTTINENVVSAGRMGGGYFAEQFEFLKNDGLQIEIKSDIVNENGQAEATYQIQNSHLSVTIEESTTSIYKTGDKITFTSFNFVDESFSETFQIIGKSYTFEGPGLLLEQQYPDQQDLDDDGNTSEMTTLTKYYSRLVRYDDGGK
ncbi:hypothetical protein [Fodinibius saliphilus]|uniref:hypothetical protein n=1 Tax=Fodinibius saliphilus TaxID=1920650 RepID=UPI001108F636|nr:hypothetical protein [Fodinibius saliphilus]